MPGLLKCHEELQIVYVKLLFGRPGSPYSYFLITRTPASLGQSCVRLNPDASFREFQRPTVPMVGLVWPPQQLLLQGRVQQHRKVQTPLGRGWLNFLLFGVRGKTVAWEVFLRPLMMPSLQNWLFLTKRCCVLCQASGKCLRLLHLSRRDADCYLGWVYCETKELDLLTRLQGQFQWLIIHPRASNTFVTKSAWRRASSFEVALRRLLSMYMYSMSLLTTLSICHKYHCK